MADERGSTTLWILALSLLLLSIGGISVDLWRALADHHALAGMADAAAVAGASGIDVGHFRATGEVRLSEERAIELAHGMFAAQCVDSGACLEGQVEVGVSGTTVLVEIRRPFRLTLLGLFVPGGDSAGLEVVVTARADAVVRS